METFFVGEYIFILQPANSSLFSSVETLSFLLSQAYGMSAMPMDLLKGKKSVSVERLQTQQERADRERKRQERRNRVSLN